MPELLKMAHFASVFQEGTVVQGGPVVVRADGGARLASEDEQRIRVVAVGDEQPIGDEVPRDSTVSFNNVALDRRSQGELVAELSARISAEYPRRTLPCGEQ
ncbi:hypothetical protein [Lentzea albidocapillata]|uniref:hypothetical protein n=1 Tax=Lentzea albidocapillata TaxID=40571 RepID=UPI00115F9252|nr:hypothetical protein [Lentzea albidocapillata]